VYATGGYANARIETWGTCNSVTGCVALNGTTNGLKFSMGSAEHDGWYAGGGVEYALSQWAIVGVEYKHYDFDTQSHVAGFPALVLGDSRAVRGDADAVMARMSLKFNPFAPAAAAPLK
jgi:opacity protein-like surface antigen